MSSPPLARGASGPLGALLEAAKKIMQDESRYQVGRALRFWLNRESDGALKGDAIGAANELRP